MRHIHSCGLTSGYFFDLIPGLEVGLNLDLKSILENLNTFVIDEMNGGSSKKVISQIDSQILAVFENILTRGLPSICSLYVERYLQDIVREQFLMDEDDSSGSIIFHEQVIAI